MRLSTVWCGSMGDKRFWRWLGTVWCGVFFCHAVRWVCDADAFGKSWCISMRVSTAQSGAVGFDRCSFYFREEVPARLHACLPLPHTPL